MATSTLVQVSTSPAFLPEEPTVSNLIDPVIRAEQEAKKEASSYDPDELAYMITRVTKTANMKVAQDQEEVSDCWGI